MRVGDYEVPPYPWDIVRVGDYEVPPYPRNAGMAKLVDALDLGSSGATHRSSSLLTRTRSLVVLTNTLNPIVSITTVCHPVA